MINQSHTSRATLLSAARLLLQRAEEVRLIHELLPWLQSVEAALTRLTGLNNALLLISSRTSEQILVARQAESAVDARVTTLCRRLRTEADIGNVLAQAAMRLLFPEGASAITKLGGNVLLTRYEGFREQLSIAALPAVFAADPAMILSDIDAFADAMRSKEQLKLQRKAAGREANEAEAALRQSLLRLERISGLHMSREAMLAWTEPVRALSRKAERVPPAAA